MSVAVTSFACKRPKGNLLIINTLKKICPRRLSKFAYLPSVGASGGILIVWNDAIFNGDLLFQNNFSISINFTCKLSNDSWVLTSVYGPCQAEQKALFIDWFANIDMPDETDWIVLGDFNFIRGPEDRNKPGGDINDMILFNDAINRLGLIEPPLKGRKITWSNMQQDPLLEKLDWVFTSASWTISYPSSFVYPMVKPTSDHVPCVIAFESNIPRSPIFRFENYWLHHSSFKSLVQNA
jgi:hypothetical protein